MAVECHLAQAASNMEACFSKGKSLCQEKESHLHPFAGAWASRELPGRRGAGNMPEVSGGQRRKVL